MLQETIQTPPPSNLNQSSLSKIIWTGVWSAYVGLIIVLIIVNFIITPKYLLGFKDSGLGGFGASLIITSGVIIELILYLIIAFSLHVSFLALKKTATHFLYFFIALGLSAAAFFPLIKEMISEPDEMTWYLFAILLSPVIILLFRLIKNTLKS